MFPVKLQQAYEMLAPDVVRVIGEQGKHEGEDDANRGDLRTGLVGPAKGRQHHCQPDGSPGQLCTAPRIRRVRGDDL